MVCWVLEYENKCTWIFLFQGNGTGKSSSMFVLWKIFFFYSVVEFDEFVKVMGSTYAREFTDEEMRGAFRRFDTDNSGE
jgi:hypothetical protein